MKKNLLIVTSTFPRWKNDTDPPFVFELAKRLTGAFDVTVLSPSYHGVLQHEIMDSVKVHRFRYFLNSFETLAGAEGILPTLKRRKLFLLLVPFLFFAELAALLKLIRKTQPDVIHAHWILPQGFVAALAHKMTGVPYVVTTHGGDIYGMQGILASAMKSFALRSAATVTVVSNDIKKTIEDKFGVDIHTKVISMGVDAVLFHPDKSDPGIRNRYGITGPFLLYVGRLSEKKGVKYLLEAMPLVLEKLPVCKLLIVGTGELEQKLRKQVDSLKLTGHIIFTGAVPNNELPSYFASADVFIGPSVVAPGGDTEGFGLTFVEAAMSGCIVVGTSVGGISDIIQDGKSGFLVPEKNPQAIADVLSKILQDQQKMDHIKQSTRERMAQQFDWQVIADRYAKILNDEAK
jgi:glycosyltransferase involved in cell wall biosynthesis